MNFNAAAFRKFAGTPKRAGLSPQKKTLTEDEELKIKQESSSEQSTITSPTSTSTTVSNPQRETNTTDNKQQKVDKTDITCVPGDRLCKADERTIAGAGTYKSEDFIYASLAGRVIISYPSKDVKFIGVEGKANKKANREYLAYPTTRVACTGGLNGVGNACEGRACWLP